MSAASDAASGLGAHAHCLRHSPGQRPGAQALVAWQSRAGGRFVAAEMQSASPMNPSSARRAPSIAADSAPQLMTPTALDWRAAAAADGPCALGRLQLWAALPDDVEWLDLTLALHRRGRWWQLHPELLELAAQDDSDAGLLLVLPDDEAAALAALAALGISIHQLRLAAQRPDVACWCCRLEGMGAFVAGLVDLGWPSPLA